MTRDVAAGVVAAYQRRQDDMRRALWQAYKAQRKRSRPARDKWRQRARPQRRSNEAGAA